MVQVPAVTMVTVVPAMVHTLKVVDVYVIASPDDAVASGLIAKVPLGTYVCAACAPKVMVWLACAMANVTGTSAEAVNISASNNNTFVNNTLSSASAITVDISAAAQNNTFYYNNFTSGSRYIRDREPGVATTVLNTTVDGVPQGNYWGDIAILDIFSNGTNDGLEVGLTGTQYPYNSTNTANLVGNITDYGPLFARISTTTPTTSII